MKILRTEIKIGKYVMMAWEFVNFEIGNAY